MTETPQRPRTGRGTGAVFAIIMIGYLLVAGAYALRTPDWQTPDEPAHYNYIAQIAANGCCPVIAVGDWDQAYLSELTAGRFAPALLGDFAALQYEDHQPPLYYALAALIYQLTAGSLAALRLFSAVIGLLVIASAFTVGRWIAPDRPALALLAAAITAFVPQHIAILASVNNDALAFALAGAAYVGLAVYLRGSFPVWLLGVIVGIGALTKVSLIFLFGLVPLAIVFKTWGIDRRFALRPLVVFFIPALGLSGLWWLRNLSVYGLPDLFGLAAHDAVVIGQLRTADLIDQIGAGEYARRLIETTFNSFWGQLGWMAAPLPAFAYTAIAAALVAAALGGLLRLTLWRTALTHDDRRRALWLILGIAMIVGLAQYGYYNTSFVQFQGRYLFPTLIPFALLVAWGWEGVIRLAPTGIARAALAAAPIVALVALNGWVILRVLPGLAP